jgi:hypothetical protein
MATALLIFPNFLLILIGTLLARGFDYRREFWDTLERLVYYVLFPALLFRALLRADIDLKAAASLIFAALLVVAGALVLSAVPRFFAGMRREVFAACYQCGFRFNSYIALGAAGALGDPHYITLMAVLIGVAVPILNVASVAALSSQSPAPFWKEIMRNPLILATVGGLLANMLGMHLPQVVDQTLELLGTAALPAGLLSVGAALRLDQAPGALAAPVWWFVLKLAGLPALAWAAALAFDLPASQRTVLILWAALPTATSAYILAVRMGADARPVAVQITLQTLASMLTLPFWLALALAPPR